MLTNKEVEIIESKIGYNFSNKQLLKTSFMHSSRANMLAVESNERLEFLGDSILNFITTEFLYNHFNQAEGYLSKAKAYLVSAKYLSKYIKSIEVINFLHCKTFNPATSENVMGDLFEAILGAIYLDCKDMNICRSFVIERLNFTTQTLQQINDDMQDYKTRLQELVQQNPKDTLEYRVLGKTGPAHMPVFEIGCFINNEQVSYASSSNKKDAENLCAKIAYDKISSKN